MNIEIVPLKDVKNNPDNPRIISDAKFEKLINSIKNFPEMLQLRPIVVNADNVVLGGNMRLKACRAAGLREVPIIRAENLTPDQQREFIVKDNINFGEWDLDQLRLDWGGEDLGDWGLDLPMPEVVEEPEAKEDDYQIPDKIKTDIVEGDVFEIGPHRLICGDARNPATWARIAGGRMFDLIVTDPPYNVDYGAKNAMLNRTTGNKRGNRIESNIAGDRQSADEFYKFLLEAFEALATFTRPGGAWYVWHAETEGINFRAAFVDAGIMFKQTLVWVKNNMVLGRNDYHWKHEPCLYGWKPGAAHYFINDRTKTTVLEDLADLSKMNKKQLQDLIRDLTRDTGPASVIHCDKPQASDLHPTMKPVKLIAQQIENSSKVGDAVADGFGGSGTTMVACDQLKRVCFMAEDDPKYCQVIIDRMKALNPALTIKRVNDGIF